MSTLLPLANTGVVVEEFTKFLASRMPNAALRYAVTFFGKGMSRNVPSAVQKASSLLVSMDVLTPDNKLDVDKLHQLATETFNDVGKFEIYGYSFDNVEIDALAEIARRHCGG